ncbi:FG-GAP repeat protein [Marinicella sp. W31]|uniref:FG-GAP repeat protein n=1 Tax=Marinicella sp. W31 TaxID=3023713 RepID=UPI0037569DA7
MRKKIFLLLLQLCLSFSAFAKTDNDLLFAKSSEKKLNNTSFEIEPKKVVLGGFTDETKLTSMTGTRFDFFGRSVSLSGNRALIGARLDDENGSNAGAAYIFEYDGVVWNETHKLIASDGEASDLFGQSVSLSGNRAFISAIQDDDNNAVRSGSVYVFEYDGSEWIQMQKLTASDATSSDIFGLSISQSENVVFIGSEGNDKNANASGAVYVFELSGNIWQETQKITASDATSGDQFGVSVNISGEQAIIGSLSDEFGTSSGSVYFFEFDGTNWIETQKLTPSDAERNGYFGFSVAISGNLAIVGSYNETNEIGFGTGSVYVLRKVGVNWEEIEKLIPDDLLDFSYFGYSVSLSGDFLLVGAPGITGNTRQVIGTAYLFRFNGTNWQELRKFSASDGFIGNQFGRQVSLSENNVLIGAFLDNENGEDSGAAYIYLRGLGQSRAVAVNSFSKYGFILLIFLTVLIAYWKRVGLEKKKYY